MALTSLRWAKMTKLVAITCKQASNVKGIPYSAITGQEKILAKKLSQRIGEEIFGELCSK